MSLGWLHISEKKIIEHCNSVGAGAHKVGKTIFGPTLSIILPTFGERKKGKLYILKKVGLSTINEMFKKFVYNSTAMFLKILPFCLKGYSENLNEINKAKVFSF